jgi:hypothetical protein
VNHTAITGAYLTDLSIADLSSSITNTMCRHCEGPRTGGSAATGSVSITVTAPTSTPTEDHDHDDHASHSDHASGTGSLSPSPTESVGCERHGDHWHCDGPAVTVSTTATRSPNATGVTTVPTGGANGMKASALSGVAVAVFLGLLAHIIA